MQRDPLAATSNEVIYAEEAISVTVFLTKISRLNYPRLFSDFENEFRRQISKQFPINTQH